MRLDQMSRIAVTVLAALLMTVPSIAATHVVDQVGFAFDPPSIDIQVGDTVEWHWQSGIHTVTEGDNCAPSGFDFPLTSGNPIVSVTFNSVGAIDYHCIPHCLAFDMVGVVNVGQAVPATNRLAVFALLGSLVLIGILMLRRRDVRGGATPV